MTEPNISASGESVSGPRMPPLSEMRNMTKEESEEFRRMSLKDAKPLPVSSPPDITEAIRAIEHFAFKMGEDHTADRDPDLDEAVARLESIFRQQQEEIESLEYEKDCLLKGYAWLKDQYARMEDSQLTPEEADFIMVHPIWYEMDMADQEDLRRSVIVKLAALRSLSTKGTAAK